MHYIQTNCVYNICKITLHEEEEEKEKQKTNAYNDIRNCIVL